MNARTIVIAALLGLCRFAVAQEEPAAPQAPAAPLTDPAPAEPTDLVSSLAGIPGAASFRIAVEASGLAQTLATTGPFTMFVPSDEAMARLDKSTLRSLLQPEMQSALVAVVAHHIVPGRRSASDLARLSAVPALSGRTLDIRQGQHGPVIAGAALVRENFAATNGVIHVIDTVLLPTTRDLRAALEVTGRFHIFLSLCETAELEDMLQRREDMTVLAPTDEAFSALPQDTVELLSSSRNRDKLRSLIESHFIRGRMSSREIVDSGPVRTVADTLVRCALGGESQAEALGAVRIFGPDIDATNGVVHAISELAIPLQSLRLIPDGRLVVGIFLDKAGSVLANQFALDGRNALVVTGLTKGGPAQQVGIQENDVLVAVNGRLASNSELSRAKESAGYGGAVELTLYRKGRKMVINVPVGIER